MLSFENMMNSIPNHVEERADGMIASDGSSLKLSFHSRKHKTAKCPLCNRPFLNKQKMEAHLRVHTGERPYKCELCSKSFNAPPNYYRHKKQIHGTDRSDRPFECSECGKRFRSKWCLYSHAIMHGVESGSDCTCETCGQCYQSSSDLWIHRHKDHRDPAPYECNLCRERFCNNTELTKHFRRHGVVDVPQNVTSTRQNLDSTIQEILEGHVDNLRETTGAVHAEVDHSNTGFQTISSSTPEAADNSINQTVNQANTSFWSSGVVEEAPIQFCSMWTVYDYVRQWQSCPHTFSTKRVSFALTKETLVNDHHLPAQSVSLTNMESMYRAAMSGSSFEQQLFCYRVWEQVFSLLQGYTRQFWNSTYQFLNLFGSNISHLTISQEECAITPKSLVDILKNVLVYVPQLKNLTVEVTLSQGLDLPENPGCYVSAPEEPTILQLTSILKSASFPSLAELETIEFVVKEYVSRSAQDSTQWKPELLRELLALDISLYTSKIWNTFPALKNVFISFSQTMDISARDSQSDSSKNSSYTQEYEYTGQTPFSQFQYRVLSTGQETKCTYGRNGYLTFQEKHIQSSIQ